MDVQLSYADWLQIQRNQSAALNTVFTDGTAVIFSTASHETHCESDSSGANRTEANSEVKEPDFD